MHHHLALCLLITQAVLAGDTALVENPQNRLRVQFTAAGLTAQHPDGFFSLHLTAYGYGDRLRTPAPPSIHSDGARVEYRRGGLTEWYLNEPRGLEQGFTLRERPRHAGAGPLTLEMTIGGDLSPVLSGRDIRLEHNGHEALRYTGLRAWDAAGRDLPARFEVRESRIFLRVTDTGAAYPVTVDPWFQQTMLTPSDFSSLDFYGSSVSASGDTVIVGAPLKTIGANQSQGVAYVFVRNGTVWTQQAELTPSDGQAYDEFGSAVAISGDTAVIGSAKESYVFVRNGTAWSQQQELTGGSSGVSVAVSGDTVVVGAPGTNMQNGFFGAAYVFVRNRTVWSQQQELVASAAQGFGISVSVDGDTAVIGETGSQGGGSPPPPPAYVFVRNGTVWTQQAELLPDSPSGVSGFGLSVSVSGDTALIGASPSLSPYGPAAYVFVRSGMSWTQQQALVVLNFGLAYDLGSSVALSGDTAVTTSYRGGPYYVFLRNGTVWDTGQQISSGPGSVAASGRTVVTASTYAGFQVQVFVRPADVRDFRLIGRSDALLYDPSIGQSYTALSNGEGSYSYVPNLYTPAFDTLRTTDFNDDGKSDLLLYNSHTGLTYAGFSNGDGTFSFQPRLWSPGYDFVEPGHSKYETGFALYNSSTGTMYTTLSNGDGTYKYTLISKGYTFVRLADFDGDGEMDIFLYNATNGLAFLGIGDGLLGFSFTPLFISPGYNLADIGDLNGDGYPDVILYNSSNGNAATGIGDGIGGFTFTPMIFSPGFTSVTLADYTGDGKADVILYNKNNAAAYFGTGTGTGNFTFQPLFWSPGYDSVIPQDVNGDGKIDVVLYNSVDGTEYTGISNGNGTFTYSYQYWGIGKILAR